MSDRNEATKSRYQQQRPRRDGSDGAERNPSGFSPPPDLTGAVKRPLVAPVVKYD